MAATKNQYPPRFLNILSRYLGWGISKVLWFLRVRGLENVPAKEAGPFIVASNHQTYIDPAWISRPLKRPLQFMAFDEAFKWPVIGPVITYLGAFPVSLEIGATLKAMKRALQALRDGAILVVFPEGGREFANGEVMNFKEGVVRLASQAKVPILPVTISGGNRVWPQGQKYPRVFSRVTVTYHPPLIVDDQSDLDEMNKRLREIITSAL